MTTDIDRGGLDVGGAHEPSYYEIALTNRQVMVAFVVLLACVVAAFLSGVWLGRESAVRAQEKLSLLTRGAAAGAAGSDTPADKEKPDGQALQEFKFFADSRHRSADNGVLPTSRGGANPPAAPAADDAAPAAPAATDSADAGNGGDAAGADADANANRGKGTAHGKQAAVRAPGAAAFAPAAASAASSPVAAPPASPAGRPVPAGRAAATAASSTAATQKSAKAAPTLGPAGEGETAATGDTGADVVKPRPLPDARAGAAAGNGKKTAAAGGEVVIQVFSSADKEQADQVKDGLVSRGFGAFLSPIDKDGQTMYRVRIGPFANRAAAEPVAEKVRKEQKLDTWITPK